MSKTSRVWLCDGPLASSTHPAQGSHSSYFLSDWNGIELIWGSNQALETYVSELLPPQTQRTDVCKSSISGVLIFVWEEEMLHQEGKKNLDGQALLGFPTQSIRATVLEDSKGARFRELPDS